MRAFSRREGKERKESRRERKRRQESNRGAHMCKHEHVYGWSNLVSRHVRPSFIGGTIPEAAGVPYVRSAIRKYYAYYLLNIYACRKWDTTSSTCASGTYTQILMRNHFVMLTCTYYSIIILYVSSPFAFIWRIIQIEKHWSCRALKMKRFKFEAL